jgi:hypothetical protein
LNGAATPPLPLKLVDKLQLKDVLRPKLHGLFHLA